MRARLKMQMNSKAVSTAWRLAVLAAFYLIGGLLGREYSFQSGEMALVWPPSGIALAAILLWGYRFWPGVAAGAILFSLINGMSPGFMLGLAVSNTMGAVVCAYLLERFIGFRPTLERVRDVAGFVGLACLLGTTVNALFNVVSLHYAGWVQRDELFSSMVDWWVPNAMAGLVVAPVILAWGTRSGVHWSAKKLVEAILCAAGLAVGTWISFHSWYVYGVQNYPLAYLPYPFLVWGALRFGQIGATTGTFVVSALAVAALIHGRGPFVTYSEHESLMLIGSYIGILAVTNMLLAAVSAERDRAQISVQESEKRYRAVVEDQTELIWRFAPDGTLTFVNEAYCRFHASTRAELLGSNFLASLSEPDREIPLAHFNSMPPDQPAMTYDHRVRLPDGQTGWQQCTIRRLFDPQGHTAEFQAVALDITARKQSEEATRHSEERLRAILNSMVDGVVVVDARDRVIMFNPAAEKLFGRPVGEALTRPVRDLFTPAGQAAYDDYLLRHLQRNGATTIEIEALHPDGTVIPADLAVSEVFLGSVRLLIVVVRDISERKNFEEHIRQSQKIEAVGRLAGGIAHDFNNIIQAIIGCTNSLLQRIDAADRNRETVEHIERTAERAAALTQQLLAFSRKQVIKPSVLSLNAVIADMNKLLERLIGDVVALVFRPAPDPGHVLADRGQIEQVILNLAINARDAMSSRGLLVIETASVVLQAPLDGFSPEFAPGQYICLTVADNGAGITPEVRARMFEPFFTTKEPGKGTGLGLSIVYDIIQQCSGEILVHSDPGQGTTFEIYLPRHFGPAAEPAGTAGAPGQCDGDKTILLVEDAEIVRTMLAEALKARGYTVIEASDGVEALQVAANHPGDIDVLVTDLVMPNMSGHDLAAQLTTCRPGLRVLYISGHNKDEIDPAGHCGKAAVFLQKPFRPQVLLDKLREVINQPPQ